jgi:hypothetical protein
MKKKLNTIIIAALSISLGYAEEKHDHDHGHEHKKTTAANDHDHHDKKGPNGGHIHNTKQGIILEIVVDADRKAHIFHLDDKMKALPLGEMSVSGIAGERSAPTKLEFAKKADAEALVSSSPLPAGAHVPMILQIKTTTESKAITTRFELHLH